MKGTEGTSSAEQHGTTTNKPVLDHNNIPIEELLGSVTTYNNVEGSDAKSQQLRTSARVFKKMKLDLTTASPTIVDKKEPLKDEVKTDAKPEAKKPVIRPMWLPEDKNLFFEALNYFGKDFEAIHLYISNKLKKKGLPESVIKTKDQVRHFYYRSWHKISKHLKFSEDVNKKAQELYALINYGEVRKKTGSVSEKTCMKLNELIYRGSLAIRVKGKTIRIKTPMCRALRKLNQLDEKHEELKLPTRVTVEIVPKDMCTWLKVQEMSMNPRLTTTLPLQKRLSSLLTYLNAKWKPANVTHFENALGSLASAYDTDTKDFEETKAKMESPLRLAPPPKTNINIPLINLSEYFTRNSICLNAFEERLGVKTPGEQLCVFKGAPKKNAAKRPRNESTSEKCLKPTIPISTDTNENCLVPPEVPNKFDQAINDAVDFVLAFQQKETTPSSVENASTAADGEMKSEVKEEALNAEEKDAQCNNIRNGWTIDSSGSLTIGELYLMFGSHTKLRLEYSWDSTNVESEEKDKLDMEMNFLFPQNTTREGRELSATLQRLLSIAKLHYRKNIVHCPCGHVCSTKSNVPKDGKTTAKVNRNILPNDIKITHSEINGTTVPILIHTPVRELSPLAVFRRPVSPNMDALRAQLDRLKPRYCNRRGRRPRAKQVIVERKLPLLPNNSRVDGRQIVQMNIISQDGVGAVRTQAKPLNVTENPTALSQTSNFINVADGFNMATNADAPTAHFASITCEKFIDAATTSTAINPPELDMTDNATTPSRVGSPTSISNLLDITFPSQESNLNNHALGSGEDSGITSFVELLADNMVTSTPPSSPSAMLRDNDQQWLNSEVADFSLSSLLGNLESPLKGDSDIYPDVDVHLQSLLTEPSVDYVAKFADLAAEVGSDSKK